jgi:HPt (histidine-containing phosphotransfer) domain-containing protein
MRALERTRARRTPILAMSAAAFGNDVQACRDAGMDDHIAKPFQPKELLAWLEEWVASALHGERGVVGEPPRRRFTAREAELQSKAESARRGPLPHRPPSEGAVDDLVLGPLLDDEGGRSLAEELVTLFATAGPETVSSLERGLEAGELEEVARIAHRFVSTSGSVGAVRLARLLRAMEGACTRQRKDEASALFAQVSGELDVANAVLQRRFGGAPRSLSE